MSFQTRCEACRENDMTRFYRYCAGCQIRLQYANRASAEPIACPEIKREVFPTSFPPPEKS